MHCVTTSTAQTSTEPETAKTRKLDTTQGGFLASQATWMELQGRERTGKTPGSTQHADRQPLTLSCRIHCVNQRYLWYYECQQLLEYGGPEFRGSCAAVGTSKYMYHVSHH